MKPPSITTILPAVTIALGVTAIASQPSYASDYNTDFSYDDWSYSGDRIEAPALERAYRSDTPAYHYAYYAIARPEYLL